MCSRASVAGSNSFLIAVFENGKWQILLGGSKTSCTHIITFRYKHTMFKVRGVELNLNLKFSKAQKMFFFYKHYNYIFHS